jgi:hypothetical protein
MFDLIADWLLDNDPGSPADVDALITDLTDFYRVMSDGLALLGRESTARTAR